MTWWHTFPCNAGSNQGILWTFRDLLGPCHWLIRILLVTIYDYHFLIPVCSAHFSSTCITFEGWNSSHITTTLCTMSHAWLYFEVVENKELVIILMFVLKEIVKSIHVNFQFYDLYLIKMRRGSWVIFSPFNSNETAGKIFKNHSA